MAIQRGILGPLLTRRAMKMSLAWLALLVAWTPASAAEVDFERDVAPLLVRHCLACHNASELAGGLDLGRHDAAFKGGESGSPALVAGDVESSYLVEQIKSGAMPPPGKAPAVPPEALARIEAWIAAGADWPKDRTLSAFEFTTDQRAGRDWWSLLPVCRPEVPQVENASLARTPIDHFVLAKLAAKNLEPSPETDRATYIRRASLDLLGLAPSRADVEAFVTDTRPDAYERLVDRLLASPRYGERWGRHWLDIARFGESNGYETNTRRPNAWPYRDWVIDAFNRDLPYPEFIVAQLAGDQLGIDAATGFLVGGAHDVVASPDLELTLNQRANDLDDMISTTSTAFLGLTVSCAKCHDHKFDPISQHDYYAVQAVFAGVEHAERELRTADYAERRAHADRLRQELDRLRRQQDELTGRNAPLARVESPDTPSPGSQPQRPAVHPRRNIDRFAPVSARFVRFTVLATSNIEPCIDELEIFTAGDDPRNVALASAGAKATASSIYANGTSDIHRLEHVNDGAYGNGRSWISGENGAGWVQIELAADQPIERIEWARDREERFSDRLATQYRIDVSGDAQTWQTVATAADRAAYDPQAAERPLTAGLSEDIGRQVEQIEAQAARLREELGRLAPGRAYLGTFRQPEATFVYHRGDPMQKREQVPPGALASVGNPLTLAADAPEAERRIALARWLGSESNPLTARVMVNRIWHYHFGRGLVKTPSDFGFGGGRPSHPELLDYLAGEFIAGGWRPKAIHRLILLSHTYRQSSHHNDAAAAVDAQCELLWRFPPRRLEAEAIRDNILQATGVLDLAMGGPGYDAFQANDNYVKVYLPKQEFGPAEWRRMVYQEKPRARQDGTFGVFDCPDASQSVGRRNVSTTALQALNLLNSAFIVQQSELLAQRLAGEAAETDQQVDRAFWLLFCRKPADEELTAARTLITAEGLVVFCRAMLNANEFLYLD